MIIKAKSYFATAFFMDVREIAGSSPTMTEREKNTRHLLTICTQEASRFSKGSRRSQYCGQAGYSLRASAKVLAAAGVAVKPATAWQTKYSPLKKYLMIIIKRFVT